MSEQGKIERLIYLLGQIQILSAGAGTSAAQNELNNVAAAITGRLCELVEKEVSEQ